MSEPDRWAIGSSEWPGLSKLTEEAGEVLQVIGKLMGNGGERAHWDGTDLQIRMMDELGDLLASVDFVIQHNFTQAEKVLIIDRSVVKRALFEEWHAEQMTPECSGLSASWCDAHGACTCPSGADARHRDDSQCPLHAESSSHG